MVNILNKINSPSDLKGLSIEEFALLAKEIRDFLIDSIANTGGHLASSLGVVELTLALHKVFNTPTDKIIWDVGHQAYVHKILTGRKDRFNILRKLNGLSGFPKSRESAHDAFDTGHSSTAISAALGFCVARDLQNKDYNVAAVVGDGSMTGGLVYEALNNAGRAGTNLLVVLNDNQMSISENVGAISRHLNDIRTAAVYENAKNSVHKLLSYIPGIGKIIDKCIKTFKQGIKSMILPGILFEELGFAYYGPIDGHDIKTLINTLQKLKDIKGPVLLHVITKKGKGYSFAEASPNVFHGAEPFNVETGKFKNTAQKPSYTEIFGKTLTQLAKSHNNLVAITAAMITGTGLHGFQKQYPHRLYDVGIAEGHAVTFAAGLAKDGILPVVSIYSSFLQRAYDQILHDVCIQNLHVVFAIDRAGIVGADGETHQGLFDLSYLSHMPNMTIMAPKNGYEFESMLHYAVLQHNGPIAVRYPRALVSDVLPKAVTPIEYATSETIFEGNSAAIVSVGTMMDFALSAVEELKNNGHNLGLYNARFIKPIDNKLVSQLLKYQHIFVLEDNVQKGGYGESLLASIAEAKPEHMPQVHFLSFPDNFIEQGTAEELFGIYGLDKKGVVKAVSQCYNK